jgi:hypothetical protein
MLIVYANKPNDGSGYATSCLFHPIGLKRAGPSMFGSTVQFADLSRKASSLTQGLSDTYINSGGALMAASHKRCLLGKMVLNSVSHTRR